MQNKIKEITKRFGIAVVALTMLGVAGVFSLFEPTPSSAKSITSEDVRLASERIVTQSSDSNARGRNGNLGGNGRTGRYR